MDNRIHYQETAQNTNELGEKFSGDLSIFDSQIVTSKEQIRNVKVKYIIYVIEQDFYVIVYDKTLQECMLEKYCQNNNNNV